MWFFKLILLLALIATWIPKEPGKSFLDSFQSIFLSDGGGMEEEEDEGEGESDVLAA